MKFRLGHNF